MKLEKILGLGTRETGCNNEVSLRGVQLCILLGVGGVKTKHGPPTFDQVQLTALTCIWTRSMDSKIMGNKQLQPLQLAIVGFNKMLLADAWWYMFITDIH